MEMLEVKAPLKKMDEIVVLALLLEVTRMVGRMRMMTMRLLLEAVND